MPIGSQIIVEGFRAKSGIDMANGRGITFPDGGKLFVGSLAQALPAIRSRINRR